MEEDVETGGGQSPEEFGESAGTVNPGAEDLGISEDDSDE